MSLEIDGRGLRRDVEHLATDTGRMVHTQGHQAARDYLLDRLGELGLDPYVGSGFELPYEVDGKPFANVVGRVRGTDASLAPVLLAAHYDTCGPLPGADDNAAAIAILLAIAPSLRQRPLRRDVLLAFFDAEEPPHFLTPAMGSVHFYYHQRTGPIHGTLVLDLVGHDVPLAGLANLLFITGMESDPAFASILRTVTTDGLTLVPALNEYIGDMSDHHVFRVNRRPYLFLSCGRWHHYHSETDTPEKLNYDKMAAIAALVLDLTGRMAVSALSGPFEGYDTTPAELEFMRSALGPMLTALGIELNGRSDIDEVARLFVGRLHL